MAQTKHKQQVFESMLVVMLIVLTTNASVARAQLPPLPLPVPACLQFIQTVVPFTGTIVTELPNDPSGTSLKITDFVNGDTATLRADCGLPDIQLTDEPVLQNCLSPVEETFVYLVNVPNRLRENSLNMVQENVQFLTTQSSIMLQDCSMFLT